jgi:glycosyltransferase involved in cell wall biosynthesis
MSPRKTAPAGALVSRPALPPQARVSVIVPVLNGEAFLRESLDSILGQTHAPFEVIVMDDGSSDSTPAIAQSYGAPLRYVRQPVNRGQFGNANDGIALAKGELIAVFHADDVYAPEMIEREVAWLEAHPAAGAVFCSDVFIDADGHEFGRLVLPPEIAGSRSLDYATILNALLVHSNSFLRCPTAIVRASVYQAVGVYRDEEFKNTSDLEMWLRIARRYEIGVLDDHLLRYRRGHGSSSEQYHRVRTEPFRLFRILDAELEAGGRAIATPDALRAYEAHRNVDVVLRAVNHYILGDAASSLRTLKQARIRSLARSEAIQRGRMIALTLSLHLLLRLPRIPALARLFDRHWYGAQPPAGAS